jgi:hypothetical protein
MKTAMKKADAGLKDAYMRFHSGHDQGFPVQPFDFVQEQWLVTAVEGQLLDRPTGGYRIPDFFHCAAEAFRVLFRNHNRQVEQFCDFDQMKAVMNHLVLHLHHRCQPFLNVDDYQCCPVSLKNKLVH